MLFQQRVEFVKLINAISNATQKLSSDEKPGALLNIVCQDQEGDIPSFSLHGHCNITNCSKESQGMISIPLVIHVGQRKRFHFICSYTKHWVYRYAARSEKYDYLKNIPLCFMFNILVLSYNNKTGYYCVIMAHFQAMCNISLSCSGRTLMLWGSAVNLPRLNENIFHYQFTMLEETKMCHHSPLYLIILKRQ